MTKAVELVNVPIIQATRENIAEYGLFIGIDVPDAGLTIPFYKGAVEEGFNIPFEYHGNATIRTARIHKRSGDVIWLERHMRMTQLFVGLGDQPFAMVLGKPNHGPSDSATIPNLDEVKCFVLQPGHGVMLWKGTWHDFPLCVKDPVTVLTANSNEVVETLAKQKAPDEMNEGDVYKIDIKKRTGKVLHVQL
jgi:ureidoglycolate lyase